MSDRIRRLVDEVDEQHREGMRTIADDLAAAHLDETDQERAASRRRFMRNLGLGGAVAVGAAVVPVSGLVGVASAQTTATTVVLPASDLQTVVFAQGLELALVAGYTLAVNTVKLESKVAEVFRLFGRHHNEHATALGALAGSSKVTAPNAALVSSLTPQIKALSDQEAATKFMGSLEQGAAATYLTALGSLQAFESTAPVSTILPIEAQHATVLGELSAQPVSEWMPAFQTTTGAFSPTQYPA